MPKTEYIPGVCNIGKAEIERRKRIGWVGAGLTAVLWLALHLARAPAPWRTALFIPAAIAAVGFLQAALHFCAAFGMRGALNFGPTAGKTDTVAQAEFRRQDRRKAVRILLYSTLFGIAAASAGYVLA